MPSVAALHVYPVKGLGGHHVDSVQVERCGFRGDRRWLIVDPDGSFLTQRQLPAMATIAVVLTPSGLVLQAPGRPAIAAPYPDPQGAPVTVTVWRSTVAAVAVGAAVDAWLTGTLGLPCRLVYMADPAARPVDPAYGTTEDRVSFADSFPVLLASESSLADLNRRLAQPVPLGRFRANLLITGAAAWEEDRWRRLRIGGLTFRLCKPCSRCVVTTIDQETGTRPDPQEPLRTLARFRRAEGGVMFGQNMIPDAAGIISVGDPVVVIEAGASNVVAAAARECG